MARSSRGLLSTYRGDKEEKEEEEKKKWKDGGFPPEDFVAPGVSPPV